MDEQNIVNIIFVTEQLAQIDFIEKILKKSRIINTYQTNQSIDIKNILEHEDIKLIIVDDIDGTLAVGNVKNVVKDLAVQTPILQLISPDNKIGSNKLVENGASIVCPRKDAQAIFTNVNLLLGYNESLLKIKQHNDIIDAYKHKFDDLYQGLADPVCYLQDGFFVDCNPAFLHAFEVSDKKELQELTIMQFISPREQTNIKNHLRKSTRLDLSATPVVFKMQTKLGSKVEYIIMSKPAKFNGEEVIQVYMRSTRGGNKGGGVSLYDKTTGLVNREQMWSFLEHKIAEFKEQDGRGVLAYILVSNYRDVWGIDGFDEAEKFINATAKVTRLNISHRAEVSRYTDDSILLFLPDLTNEEAGKKLKTLINTLDATIPDGMERMIEPICYVGYDEVTKDSNYKELISKIFRAAHNAIMSDGTRTTVPSSTQVEKRDSKRLKTLQQAISNNRIKLHYQPIVDFASHAKKRYCEQISLFNEKQQPLEMDIMIGVAERYQLTHHLDKWKINNIFNQLLGIKDDDREKTVIFISISADSLKSPQLISWIYEQLQHTGLSGKYFVFEITIDNIQSAYSGAKNFVKAMQDNGIRIAVNKIGGLSKDNIRIIDDLKPEIIKIDIREIDTLEYAEEKETMEDLVDKAKSYKSTLIAECIDSPVQLSRIWRYGIKIAQGKALAPLSEDMKFDFAEFDLSKKT